MIKGVHLQNFMSYENAYIPLTSGLNLVCGPNGSGKSSILLAISIVLGQSYTERAKKLSDLIRWGQEEAKVALTITNKLEDGRRVFPQFRDKFIEVARVIRKNGEYAYFVQDKRFLKNDVASAFKRVGLNPDNMLMIMHQLMVGKFSLTTPQEKLKMLEEAIGFQSYREDILNAFNRLRELKTEEEKLLDFLESTKATYDFWRKERDKFLKKQALTLKLNEVNRETAWLKVKKKKDDLTKILCKLDELKNQKVNSEVNLKNLLEKINFENSIYNKTLEEREFKLKELISLLKEEAEVKAKLKLLNIFLEKYLDEAFFKVVSELFNEKIISYEEAYKLKQKLDEMLQSISNAVEEWELKLIKLNELIDSTQLNLINFKVELEVEKRKIEFLTREICKIEELKLIEENALKELANEAEKFGSETIVDKKLSDLILEKKMVEEQLKLYSNISENVEEIYNSYAEAFEKLKNKAEEVLNNKKKIQEELKNRQKLWSNILKNFLKELSEEYNFILSFLGGKGEAKLINEDDIEKAGLEISVGFKGRAPKSLDSLTQSGGERSVALIAFLLALQRKTPAPFRAIDEFDVHMDPKNREIITELIASSWINRKEQYLVITPGEIHISNDNIHVIIVQSVKGMSKVSELKGNEG
ncbi:MAG: AAA family ATPase [Candidatus Bathyarchaeia archaeon]